MKNDDHLHAELLETMRDIRAQVEDWQHTYEVCKASYSEGSKYSDDAHYYWGCIEAANEVLAMLSVVSHRHFVRKSGISPDSTFGMQLASSGFGGGPSLD